MPAVTTRREALDAYTPAVLGPARDEAVERVILAGARAALADYLTEHVDDRQIADAVVEVDRLLVERRSGLDL